MRVGAGQRAAEVGKGPRAGGQQGPILERDDTGARAPAAGGNEGRHSRSSTRNREAGSDLIARRGDTQDHAVVVNPGMGFKGLRSSCNVKLWLLKPCRKQRLPELVAASDKLFVFFFLSACSPRSC